MQKALLMIFSIVLFAGSAFADTNSSILDACKSTVMRHGSPSHLDGNKVEEVCTCSIDAMQSGGFELQDFAKFGFVDQEKFGDLFIFPQLALFGKTHAVPVSRRVYSGAAIIAGHEGRVVRDVETVPIFPDVYPRALSTIPQVSSCLSAVRLNWMVENRRLAYHPEEFLTYPSYAERLAERERLAKIEAELLMAKLAEAEQRARDLGYHSTLWLQHDKDQAKDHFEYPERAERLEQEGYVVLLVNTDRNGVAINSRVIQEVPEGWMFADTAGRDVVGIRFKPSGASDYSAVQGLVMWEFVPD